jgi:tetratricopeptide (TPR) repeat protein
MRWLLCVFALTASTTASADEWVSPQVMTITSPNKRFEAVLTPAGRSARAATATIRDGGKPGVTFDLKAKQMVVDAVIFDDGTLLALDHWHSLGFGDVATLYERGGIVRWSKTLVDLIGQPLVDKAPHSVSSIWWRKTPLEWKAAPDGKSIALTLFDENQLRLTLADGSAKVEPVAAAALPEDPRRLANRAKALLGEGKDAEAIAVLERSVAKDTDFLEGFGMLAEALQRKGDHQRVVEMLDKASKRWSKAVEGHAIANVRVVWAKSLVALKRVPEAERVLREGVAAAPVYSYPIKALADHLVAHGQLAAVDVVFDEFIARLTKASYLDTYAVAEVGDFYFHRKDYAKALARYSVAYKATEVTNMFLYKKLVEVHELRGNIADAIKVNDQLIAHFAKLGSSFDRDADEAKKTHARLRALPKK